MTAASNSQSEAAREMSENTIVTSPSGGRTPPHDAAPKSLEFETLSDEAPERWLRSYELMEDEFTELIQPPLSPIALSLVMTSCECPGLA
jgi:hypothetical protein